MPEGPASAGISLRQQADKRFDARVGERVVLRVALGLVVACGHRLRAPTHAKEALLPPRVLEGSDAVSPSPRLKYWQTDMFCKVEMDIVVP